MQRNSRLKRELQMLSTEPPPGVSCWQLEEKVQELQARQYSAHLTFTSKLVVHLLLCRASEVRRLLAKKKDYY